MLAQISPGTLITRSDEILAGLVDKDFIMLNIQSGNYHRVNPTGERIWELLEHPCTFADLCTALQAEFNVSPEVCQSEVQAFLSQLSKRQLITLTENE